MILLGFLSAAFAALRISRRWGYTEGQVLAGALSCFAGGVVGARLYYVALCWSYFSRHPAEIMATWGGGMAIHGAIIGGPLAGAIFCRISKIPFLVACDIGGSVFALGQAIGRWGNFFNSEAFGQPVPLYFPLKLFIPVECRPAAYHNVSFFHPTFLYESLWDLGLFLILYFLLVERLKRWPGVCFLTYLAGYSLGRLLIEPLRLDSVLFHGMPAPILASASGLIVALLGIGILLCRYRCQKQDGLPVGAKAQQD